MPLAASIEFPRADVDALFRQIDRAQKDLGRHLIHALNSAAVFLSRSLSASTKKAPKKRRVYKTTLARMGMKGWKGKAARQYLAEAKEKGIWGVDVWRNGKKEFVPIGRGETRTVEVLSKHGVRLVKNLNTGKIVHHSKAADEFDTQTLKGAKASNLVKIRASGLAKTTWARITRNVAGTVSPNLSGAAANIVGIANKAGKYTKGKDFVRMENRLRYARSALGENINKPMNEAMYRAAKAMEATIDKHLIEKIQSRAATRVSA